MNVFQSISSFLRKNKKVSDRTEQARKSIEKDRVSLAESNDDKVRTFSFKLYFSFTKNCICTCTCILLALELLYCDLRDCVYKTAASPSRSVAAKI